MIRYILTALGLYLIAKDNFLSCAWLAWIPELNCTVLGSISDDYQICTTGKARFKRFLLPLLLILTCVVSLFMMLAASAADSYPYGFLLIIPAIGGFIGYLILHAFALYDLFRACVPDKAVLFLVLSLCVGIAEPVLIMLAAANQRKWIHI